ncbi:MAG: magnesium transporter, partial [Gammaproteobacteria bacterium]
MVSDGTSTPQLLADVYLDLYPDEAASVLEDAGVDELVALLEQQSAVRASGILQRLAPSTAMQCLLRLSDERAGKLLAMMESAHSVLVLGGLDEMARARYLELLPDALAKDLRELLSYPEDVAGHLMDRRIITFTPQTEVGEALVRLRKARRWLRAVRRDGPQYLPIVDGERKLLGMVPLVDAALAEADDVLENLMRPAPFAINAMAPRDEVIEVLAQVRVSSIPVVDLDGRLLGVIRHDALVQALQEEATVGLQTLVGVGKDERALSSPWLAVRKRLPWLNVNLLTAFLAAAVVGLFEGTIAKFTALAVLMPVVAGQSGNTGAQALAVTMRGLALREIRLRHGRQVLLKEGIVGVLNGVAIAMVTAIGVLLWSRSPGLAGVVALAMVLSMLIAGLAGAAIPLLLEATGQDPAQSGSIILTTVT